MISESAIGMSNGGRWSSANAAIMKITNPGSCGITNHRSCCASTIPIIESVPACITMAAAAITRGSS
jgi:hypothetical protein